MLERIRRMEMNRGAEKKFLSRVTSLILAAQPIFAPGFARADYSSPIAARSLEFPEFSDIPFGAIQKLDAPAAPPIIFRISGTDYSKVVAKIAPSVVTITVTGHETPPQKDAPPGAAKRRLMLRAHRWFKMPHLPGKRPPPSIDGPPEEFTAFGAGVVLSADGYIVTNDHLIEAQEEITVELRNKKIYKGILIGTDPRTDVALIKIDARNLTPAQWEDPKRVKVGVPVLAIGTPLDPGYAGTVTNGIISALGRKDENAEHTAIQDFIQTDAAINNGNSGGGLFDANNGKLIGIVSESDTPNVGGGSAGLGFAIPRAIVEPVVDQLKRYGKMRRSWLGLSFQDVTLDRIRANSLQVPPEYLERSISKGAYVTRVDPNGPGAEAGIETNDIVIAVGDKVIKRVIDLTLITSFSPIGSEADVIVLRNGVEKHLHATFGANPENSK